MTSYRSGHKWSCHRSESIHGVNESEPTMGTLDSCSECVGMCILVPHAKVGEEERYAEQWERRSPDSESVSHQLQNGAEGQDGSGGQM